MIPSFLLDALTGQAEGSPTDLGFHASGIESMAKDLEPDVVELSAFAKPLEAKVRGARMLDESPAIRSLGRLALDVSTECWRFPPGHPSILVKPKSKAGLRPFQSKQSRPTRLKPPADVVMLKERLLYLLQPP